MDGAAPQEDHHAVALERSNPWFISVAFRRNVIIAVLVLSWLGMGITVLCIAEGMHFLSAFYVLVQIISTVGYGDISVQSSNSTKLFLSFYVLVCCVIVGGAILSSVDDAMEAVNESVGQRMKRLRKFSETGTVARLSRSVTSSLAKSVPVPHTKMSVCYKLAKKVRACCKLTPLRSSLLKAMAALVIGTIFYSTVESCSCSYGGSQVDGCDPANCLATGGYSKTVLDAWYMSCVTLTTVGFGDYAPKSFYGRIFGVFWMLLGCVALGNFVLQFSKVYVQSHRKSQKLMIDVDAIFTKIDSNKNGVLDRYEFLMFALMEYGIIDMDDVDAINEQFSNFDKDGNDKVTRDEILAAYTGVWEHEVRSHNNKLMSRVSACLGIDAGLAGLHKLSHCRRGERQTAHGQAGDGTDANADASVATDANADVTVATDATVFVDDESRGHDI